MSKLELLMEAERRGILPADKAPLLEEARKRGLVPQNESSMSTPVRMMRRAYDMATFGFGDEFGALANTPIQMGQELLQEGRTDPARVYYENLEQQRRHRDEARAGGSTGVADIAADTAGLTAGAVATLPLMPVRMAGAVGSAAKPVAEKVYERFATEFGKGPAQAVAARETAANLAPMTGREIASESARVGGMFGAMTGFGEAEGDAVSQGQSVLTGTGAGYLLGRAVPNVIQAGQKAVVDPILNAARSAKAAQSREAQAVSQDFADAGVQEFAPALTSNPVAEGTSRGLMGSMFGGDLRTAARSSIDDAERAIASEMQRAGGVTTPAQAGEDAQRLLRRNLVERTIPGDDVKARSSEQLQDISGVAPGPGHKFAPAPRVQPIDPEPVTPITPDEYLARISDEIEPVQPTYPDPAKPRTYAPDEFAEAAKPQQRVEDPNIELRQTVQRSADDLAQREARIGDLAARLDERTAQMQRFMDENNLEVYTPRMAMMDDFLARYDGNRAQAEEYAAAYAGNAFSGPDGTFTLRRKPGRFLGMIGGKNPKFDITADGRVRSTVDMDNMGSLEDKNFAANAARVGPILREIDELNKTIRQEQQAITQGRASVSKMSQELKAKEAEFQTRAREDYEREFQANQRRLLEEAQARENERVARLNQTNRERAEAEALAATQAARERRLSQARPTAERDVETFNSAAEQRARNKAAEETRRLQQEADQAREAEIQQRLAKADEPFQLGKSKESYVTELDAAYEAASRNAPRIQRNPLGQTDGERTSLVRVIDQIATEARGKGQLPGYRSNNPFKVRGSGNEGGLRDDVLAYLRPRVGEEVFQALSYLSNAKQLGRVTPGVKGMQGVRSAVGKAIGDARKAGGFPGNTRTEDDAMLSRIYDALTDDIEAALAMADGGEFAARQWRQVRDAYRVFKTDLRKPLSKLFKDNVPAERAIEKLQQAASRRGDIELLRRFYRVVDDKGNRLQATNAIISSMFDGGLESFLKTYRNLSPEARELMFRGAAREYGRRLDVLARVGGRLESYVKPARDAAPMSRALSPNNVVVALLAWLNVPTALAGVGGSVALSRVMSSQRFANWLKAAPKRMRTRKDWNRHVGFLRGLAIDQLGLNDAAAEAAIEQLRIGSGD